MLDIYYAFRRNNCSIKQFYIIHHIITKIIVAISNYLIEPIPNLGMEE